MIKKQTIIQTKIIKKENKNEFKIGDSLTHDNIAELIKKSNYSYSKDFRDDGQDGLPVIMEYKNDYKVLDDIDIKNKYVSLDWNDMIQLFIDQNTLEKKITKDIATLTNETNDFILWLKQTWPALNEVVIDLELAKKFGEAFAQNILNIKTNRPQYYEPALQKALQSGNVEHVIKEGVYVYEWYISNGMAQVKRTISRKSSINLRLFLNGEIFTKALYETKDIHEAFLKCIQNIWQFTNVDKTSTNDIIQGLSGDFST